MSLVTGERLISLIETGTFSLSHQTLVAAGKTGTSTQDVAVLFWLEKLNQMTDWFWRGGLIVLFPPFCEWYQTICCFGPGQAKRFVSVDFAPKLFKTKHHRSIVKSGFFRAGCHCRFLHSRPNKDPPLAISSIFIQRPYEANPVQEAE